MTKPDAWRGIFSAGREFDQSAVLLWQETIKLFELSAPEVPYVTPAVVCSAFALELYLKALITLEMGGAPRGHSVVSLFGKTTSASQSAIRQRFSELVKTSATVHAMKLKLPNASSNLDDVLIECDRVFEKWRYSYEGKLSSPFCIEHLLQAVRDRVVTLDNGAA